jgi:hypothetical protein
MHPKRTPTWWMVRLQLAVGIGMTLLAGHMAGDLAGTICFGGGCGAVMLGPLGLPVYSVVGMLAMAIALAGLVWMVHIFRGPRDEPPPWRYRHR